MKKRSSLACAVLAISFGALAQAETPANPWDAARDPAAAARDALHRRVREIRANPLVVPHEYALLRARVLLEQAQAATSPDVRLRIDLGEIYADLEDNLRAIEVLQPALDEHPDDPVCISAFPQLANAYARLDHSKEERRVYERFLPRVEDELSHTTGVLNLAEADMHLGDLDAAIAGYEAAIDEAGQLANIYELELHTGTLARWGLAVALDRAGDIDGGGRAAKLAVQLDRDMKVIRSDPHVFFSPERERYWYVALGYAEYAKEAEDARSTATFWRRSEGCWREYLDEATARGVTDRWLDLASARLDRAHAQRVIAERKVKGRLVYPQTGCVR